MRNTANRRWRATAGKTGKGKTAKPPYMAVLWGLILACVITAMGLMLGAWLLDHGLIRGETTQYVWIVILVSVAAMLVGGGYTAHQSKERPILMAAAMGGLYVLLRIIMAWTVGGTVSMNLNWWMQMAASLGAAMLGGLLGRQRK